PLIRRSALAREAIKQRTPDPLCVVMDLIEMRARNLLLQVRHRPRFAHIRNTDLENDLILCPEVDPCSRMLSRGAPRTFLERIILPQNGRLERLTEPACDIDPVPRIRAAESPGARPPRKISIRLDLDMIPETLMIFRILVRRRNRVRTAPRVDHHPGIGSLRKREARDTRPLCYRYFHPHAVIHRHGVVSGLRLLVPAIEWRWSEVRPGTRRQFLRTRQHREIPIHRASRPTQVRQAESIQMLFVVEIPSVAIRVWAPLHHPERQRRPRKCVSAPRRPNQRIH